MSSHDAVDEPADRTSSDHTDDEESNRTSMGDGGDEPPNEMSNKLTTKKSLTQQTAV
jgi:hypothetical protein